MDNNVRDVWPQACAKLRAVLNEDTYDRWISGIVPLDLSDKACLLGVSNEIFCDWLTMNYRDLIVSALAEVTGRQLKISFESGHEAMAKAVEAAEARPKSADPAPGEAAPVAASDEADTSRYNRRFTFDTFVVGENNKFAHAACSAVAKSPGKAYNPLFIHGGTGLGKTHLLQAIAQELGGKRRRMRVEYLSSEEFANRYIDAIRDRGLPRFRQHYRNVNVLLIDDVHFFKDKEQMQEEFFHTFNALYNSHQQIVLTSDRPPHEIGGLEKRLVSRFEWGLITDIMAPDLETRIAILRKKQADHTVKLGDEILNFIATRVVSNVRRLEGALIRLVSYASVTGRPINMETSEQLLAPLLDEEATNLITVERIQRTVAEHYDVRLADMTSRRRPQNIAFPRQVAMYLCRQMTDYSSPTIAEYFNRNHATILHAQTCVSQRLARDPEFRREVSVLERKVKGN